MKICPICKTEYAGGEVFCPVDAARLSTPSQLGPAPSAEDPLVGTTLGERYRIGRRIGEGGMGIVYEAEHVVIEKRVALKVLRVDFSSRPEVVERFRQEAKSASRIGHEHIVDISDFGETPSGQSYFVMEYLEGEDLANLLAKSGTLPVERAVQLAFQCCRALGAAHAKGIVHRDMKPENIFLIERDDGQDFVKIVDFGIAKMSDIETPGEPGRKLTKTGMIFGTPEYMSPEQAAGKELDHRVDVYAVGVILFEMLTGRVPFVGDSFMGVLTQHMFEPPPTLKEVRPDADVPPSVEGVIMRALAKEAEERFQTMEELAEALDEAIARPSTATFVGYGAASKRSARGRPRAMRPAPVSPGEFPAAGVRGRRLGLVVAVALLGIGLGVGGWLSVRPHVTPAGAVGAGTEGPVEPSVVAVAADPVVPEDTAAAAPDEEPAALGPADGAAAPQGEEPPEGVLPEMVTVNVKTKPSGASLEVTGRGAVCEATPCAFETPPGVAVELVAKRGRYEGTESLTPTESTTLQMRLAPKRKSRSRVSRRSEGRSRGTVSDLKEVNFGPTN